MEAVPLIYVRQPQDLRLHWGYRLLSLVVAVGCLAVLCVAAYLPPNPLGISSHTGLGLARCQFEANTGLPCPTCGMTTSFSHFVRGNLAASFYVQPMGMVLASLTTLTFWAGLYIAITGKPIYRLFHFLRPRYYLIPFFALFVLAWAWKIWIHLTGRDGWG